MSLTPACQRALQVEVAILQAKHPVLVNVLSRAQALLVDGHVWVEDDGQTATVRSSDGARFYHVNGHCACPASQYRDEPCKHRLALRLYQRVTTMLLEDDERWTITEPTGSAQPDIAAHFIVELHGKQFVTYAGLLALAHQRGLLSLSASFISVTSELAIAQATATFRDGRTFTEAADATPGNVGAKVKLHFARMALTRAKARCLRDALNISMCSLEELDSE